LTGSARFRFYKPQTEKTEPRPKKTKKNRGKPKNQTKPEKTEPNRFELGVIIFGSVRFLSKKVTKPKFFFLKKKPKPN